MNLQELMERFRSLPIETPPFSIELFKKKIKQGYCYVFYKKDESCKRDMMVEKEPYEYDMPLRFPYPLSRENFNQFKKIYEEESSNSD